MDCVCHVGQTSSVLPLLPVLEYTTPSDAMHSSARYTQRCNLKFISDGVVPFYPFLFPFIPSLVCCLCSLVPQIQLWYLVEHYYLHPAGENNICSHHTRSCKRILVYLEPRERVWWLHMCCIIVTRWGGSGGIET